MCCSAEWKRWMLLLYCGDLTMDEAMVYVQTQIKDGNAKSDVAKVIMKLCQRTGRAGAWNPHIPWPSTVDHNHAMHGEYRQRVTDRSLVDCITVSVIDTGLGNSRRNQDDTQHCKRHKLMTSECLGLYHGREDDTRAFRMVVMVVVMVVVVVVERCWSISKLDAVAMVSPLIEWDARCFTH